MDTEALAAIKKLYGALLNDMVLTKEAAATLCLAYETRLLRQAIDKGVDELALKLAGG